MLVEISEHRFIYLDEIINNFLSLPVDGKRLISTSYQAVAIVGRTLCRSTSRRGSSDCNSRERTNFYNGTTFPATNHAARNPGGRISIGARSCGQTDNPRSPTLPCTVPSTRLAAASLLPDAARRAAALLLQQTGRGEGVRHYERAWIRAALAAARGRGTLHPRQTCCAEVAWVQTTDGAANVMHPGSQRAHTLDTTVTASLSSQMFCTRAGGVVKRYSAY